MAVYIDAAIVAVCSQMSVTIEADRLGPRQIKAYMRMAETGVTHGYSSPTMMAVAARKQAGLPWLRFGRYNRFEWGNMENQPEFFDKMASVLGVLALNNVGEYARRVDGVTLRLCDAVGDRLPAYWTYGVGSSAKEIFDKKFSLQRLLNVPRTISFDPRDPDDRN